MGVEQEKGAFSVKVPILTAAILFTVGGAAFFANRYFGRCRKALQDADALRFLVFAAAGIVADSWLVSVFFRYARFMFQDLKIAAITSIVLSAVLFFITVITNRLLKPFLIRLSGAFLFLGLTYATLAIFAPRVDVSSLRTGAVSMALFSLTFSICSGTLFWDALAHFKQFSVGGND